MEIGWNRLFIFLLLLCGLVLAILILVYVLFLWPKSIIETDMRVSQDKSVCAASGIELKNYVTRYKNATDASGNLAVKYQRKQITCTVDSNVTGDARCRISTSDNSRDRCILVSVNETQCRLQEVVCDQVLTPPANNTISFEELIALDERQCTQMRYAWIQFPLLCAQDQEGKHNCSYRCDIPLPDGGKNCSSSEECEGDCRCVWIESSAGRTLTGVCSHYQYEDFNECKCVLINGSSTYSPRGCAA